MIVRIDQDSERDRDYAIIEFTAEDGYHAGLTVIAYIADDGAPVLDISTSPDTETHEVMRVWVNEALVNGREETTASQS